MTIRRPELLEIEVAGATGTGEPFWDTDVRAVLTAPDGTEVRRDAFWDGDDRWGVRLRPTQTGTWRWRIESGDVGLDGRTGSYEVGPSHTLTRFDRHGSVSVGPDGRTFEHEDGTGFFWLGDTIWNGLFRSTAQEWVDYLDLRAGQGFTVAQVFTLPWRGCPTDPDGARGYSLESGRVVPDPAYFRRLDDRIRAANDHGFLVSAILLLALLDEDAGLTWPEEAIVRYTRWLRARWAGYEVAWTFGADGDFTGSRSDRWRRLGPDVFSDPVEPLVTMHPCGTHSCADEFRDCDWMTFAVYQSGHSGDEESNRWHVEGPYAAEATTEPAQPVRPIVNAEANYENHPRVRADGRFSRAEVRRAAYWSLFTTGVAGVAYGEYSLWAWAEEPESVGAAIAVPELATDRLAPWRDVVTMPGADDMTRLRRLLDSGPWRRLVPAPQILADQPGDVDIERFQAAARTTAGDWTVVYVPEAGNDDRGVRLTDALPTEADDVSARWFAPSTGHWLPAQRIESGEPTYRAPDASDWILDLRRRTDGPSAEPRET